MQDGVEHLHRVLALESRLAGDELVEQGPQRVHVGARVDGLAAGLLRRHVRERPEQGSPSRPGGVAAPRRAVRMAEHVVLGEAEIQDLEPTVRGHHDVRGFDVAVHDAAGMGCPKGFREAVHDLEGLLQRRWLPPCVLRQGLARHVLHRDEPDRTLFPFDLVDLVDDGDARVGEGGGCPRLAQEPGVGLLVGLHVVPQRLQGHGAVQPDVLGEVNLTHATAAEPLEDAVAPDRRADHKGSIMDPAGGRRGPLVSAPAIAGRQ